MRKSVRARVIVLVARAAEGHSRPAHALTGHTFISPRSSGEAAARPGVARLMDEAVASGVAIAACGAAPRDSVASVLSSLLGAERARRVTCVVGAEDVVEAVAAAGGGGSDDDCGSRAYKVRAEGGTQYSFQRSKTPAAALLLSLQLNRMCARPPPQPR